MGLTDVLGWHPPSLHLSIYRLQQILTAYSWPMPLHHDAYMAGDDHCTSLICATRTHVHAWNGNVRSRFHESTGAHRGQLGVCIVCIAVMSGTASATTDWSRLDATEFSRCSSFEFICRVTVLDAVQDMPDPVVPVPRNGILSLPFSEPICRRLP